jgi:peptidoglycan/xylan/chitin deacetylase (PgdA/CDA1 family)
VILTASRRAAALVAVVACVLTLAACQGGRTPRWAAPAPSASTPAAPPSPPGTPPVASPDDLPRFPPAPAPTPISLPADGSVPYLSRLPVQQPVAFLTIDDGYVKSPEALKLLAAARVPVTLFLTVDAVQDDVAYFDRLRPHGAVIEAHTITHAQLRGKPYAHQRREICGSADRLAQWYGRRPVLFRPPYGTKDATTLRAAKDCGMRAAFMWKETVHKGKVRYQEGNRIQRGDVILMHFRPDFAKDFRAALKAIHRAGLTPAALADYIPARTPPTAD